MFLTELKLKECVGEFWGGRQVWELEEALIWEHPVLKFRVTAPKGMKTDLASVPRCLHSWLPPSGLYNRAAVIHDLLCDMVSWFEAAAFFRIILGELGVEPRRIAAMYYGVLWYGRHRNVRQLKR